MTVQVTPLSGDSLGLAVTGKSIEGITVKELQSGTGTYDFDYMVMAVRKGHEDYEVIRPASVTARPSSEDVSLSSVQNTYLDDAPSSDKGEE
jgi:hypothetical protein